MRRAGFASINSSAGFRVVKPKVFTPAATPDFIPETESWTSGSHYEAYKNDELKKKKSVNQWINKNLKYTRVFLRHFEQFKCL